MIRGIVFASVVALATASLSSAQQTDSKLPGLDNEAHADMHINVRVKVDGLIEGADKVVISCYLYDNDTKTNMAVGSGQFWLFRLFATTTGPGRGQDSFDGASIDKVVSVPIIAEKPDDPSLNYWRTGICQLEIGPDDADLKPVLLETPRNCGARNPVPGGWLSCVWPGTDPAAAEIRFSRPGLPDSKNDEAE